MDEQWFYFEAEKSIGPFSWRRLEQMSEAGLIGPGTYVWREGYATWITLAVAISDHQARLHPPPPIPPPSANPPGLSPSVDQPTATRNSPWLAHPPAPWRRYGARMLDLGINGYAGMIAVAFVWYALAPLSADTFFSMFTTPGGVLLDIVLTSLLATIICGLLIGSTGTSIGKAIFGIKVVQLTNEQPIGITAGCKRELSVWVFGLGLGVPIVALATMVMAYNQLNARGTTSWDKGRYRVLHRPAGVFQTTMNIIGAVLIVILIAVGKILNAQ